MHELTVEMNKAFVEARTDFAPFIITPPLDEDYWLFRVKLYEDQAILGFPKFGTIGIGFAQEEDWNTNLPYTQEARAIYDHIKHNKKYEQITEDQVISAILLVQNAAKIFIAHKKETQA